MNPPKHFKIAFLGMGTVAQGVWRHLKNNQELMAKRFGASYELAGVCVRDASKLRDVDIPADKITTDAMKIINDPSVDIVCELMGGTTAARDYTLVALKAGKVVVSANKALISKYGDEVFSTAKNNAGSYFFEASVAGGIPIIKVLREGLVANQFSLIYGILNGTCNYILTRMEQENASYETILTDARRLGYVEADESLDVDGWDAAHKISILAYLAHGVWIKPENMLIQGIRDIRLEDMVWAKDFNRRIKLVAAVRKNEHGSVFASVYPALLPSSDVVANVNGVYNAVCLDGDTVGRTVHIGRGAGQDATASAVIADIGDAIKYLLGAPMLLSPAAESNVNLASLSDISGRFYLRMEVKDQAGVLAMISAVLARRDISIELLEQRKHETEGRAWLMLTTHTTTEDAIKKVSAELEALEEVFNSPFVLRIFDV